MNSRQLLPLVLGGLLLPSLTAAQVEVKILAAPERVFSYEPVIVVFEARNEGAAGLAIPADDSGGDEGGYLEIGPTGEALEIASLVYDGVPTRLVWLEPGDRWLFMKVVAPGREGDFDIQAVLRSLGQCTGRPVGPHRSSIKRVREVGLVAPSRPYDCWEGEARSQRVTVTVEVPSTEADLAAAEFLDLDHPKWRSWKVNFVYTFKELSERFPTSHYTYAALHSAGGSLAMVDAVILQPDNPLNPWMAGAMAAGLAHRHRPCSPPFQPGPGAAPPGLAERYQRVIAAHPPPEPLKDYLRQQALEYAEEECPERKAQEEGRDATASP